MGDLVRDVERLKNSIKRKKNKASNTVRNVSSEYERQRDEFTRGVKGRIDEVKRIVTGAPDPSQKFIDAQRKRNQAKKRSASDGLP